VELEVELVTKWNYTEPKESNTELVLALTERLRPLCAHLIVEQFVKILVCIKQVGVLSDEIEFESDGKSVDTDYLDYELNEWDSYAVEEAIQVRDRLDPDNGSVIIISIGEDSIDDSLRKCLAMGADSGVRVSGVDSGDPITVGRALADVIQEESPDLIFCGAQSADSAQGATASIVAEFLSLPCVSTVTGLSVSMEDRVANVSRELEGGLLEKLNLSLPAVLSIQTGINEPRYATFRQIKQAKSKSIREVVFSGSIDPGYSIDSMYIPDAGGNATVINGNTKEIAEKIKELVQEVSK